MHIRPSILKGLAWSLNYFIQRTHVPGEEVTHILSEYYVQLLRITLKGMKGVVVFRE